MKLTAITCFIILLLNAACFEGTTYPSGYINSGQAKAVIDFLTSK